jgi:receptor protein-tyrosine kinase
MSKNFELMQRAGKLLEIEIPPANERAVSPDGSPIAPALAPALAPTLAPEIASWRAWQPSAARTARHLAPIQVAREESRRLVQQIFMVQAKEPPRVVVFAGIDHGNGCTRICAHAAEALHENLRGSICLVEANFRSPSLPKLYGATNRQGLTDALVGEGPMRSFAKPLGNDHLYLMSCGTRASESHGLLNSARLRSRFRDLRNEFDYVLIDAPPLVQYSDAIALGKAADGLVLIVEANATRREAAARVSEHLRASQIRILAAVLNKRTFPIPDLLYRYL